MNNTNKKEKNISNKSKFKCVKQQQNKLKLSNTNTEEDSKKRNEQLPSQTPKTETFSQKFNRNVANTNKSLISLRYQPNKTITNISTSIGNESNKEDLFNRLLTYQQELETTKSIIQDQEKVYDNKIDELQVNFKNEFEQLKNKHNETITKMTNEHNQKIKTLISKNKELTERNEKLFAKNNSYIELINQIKNELGEKIFALERENTKLKNEKEYLTNYYQNKIDVNQANANLDKKLLSDKYEKVIANMKDSFAISKQNFMNILQERENEVLQNVNVHKNEKEQFHKQIVEQISKYDKLNKQYLNQLNENRTQSAEIENLKTELQRVKKELNIITKERNMLEEKCDVLFKDNNTLSNLNKELNRVTHGKFSTGSKSRISTMTSNKN